MVVKFEFDPEFEDNLLHFRGSLNRLGNVVRKKTDEIAKNVVSIVDQEARFWEETRDRFAGKYSKSQRANYYHAKAMAYSLRKYQHLIAPIMAAGESEDYGMVIAGHAASVQAEFGGADNRILLGKDNERLVYPAYRFLRRGLDRSYE